MTRERVETMPENDWRKSGEWFTEPQLTRNLALAGRLRAVGERHGVSAGAVAVAWTLRNPAVSGAIAGFRRADQVDPIVDAVRLELTEADLAEIAADSRG
jgi:aryl-alcohol dehydrogenase-like predicted oxidoreductase